jgi:streptogramin lyase
MRATRFLPLATVAAFAVAACTPSPTFAPSAPVIAPVGAGTSSAASLRLRTFTAGKTPGFLAGAVAWDITAGPGREIWFTDPATPAVGRIEQDGRVREFRNGLPAGAHPLSIILGPDGNLWFSDSGTGAVGRVTPLGEITEFGASALRGKSAMGIVAGSDKAIWTMELVPAASGGYEPSVLARVTTSGVVSKFDLPNLYSDGSLAPGAFGRLWFLAEKENRIFLIERRSDGSLHVHRTGLVPGAEPCCPNLAPKHLVVGPDGQPWFTTLYFASNDPNVQPNSLATLANGRVNFYSLRRGLAPAVWPSGIANDGSDLWISGASVFQVKGALFFVRANGKSEAFPLDYTPIGIAWAQPAVWFTSQIDGLPSSIVEATVTSKH